MRYKTVRCCIKSFQEMQYSGVQCDIKWNWNIIVCTNGRSSLVVGRAWTINITMSLLKQITRTPLLISYEQFYIQSLFPQGTHSRTKRRWKHPHVPGDIRPLHYVTSCNIHQSVLQYSSDFLDLSPEHAVSPTRLLLPLKCTVIF